MSEVMDLARRLEAMPGFPHGSKDYFDAVREAAAALTAAEARIKMLSEALAGVMPLTSYGPEGKSPPDELAAIAAGYAALGFCPDCGAGPKDKCRYNAMGQSCREVLRPRQAKGSSNDG